MVNAVSPAKILLVEDDTMTRTMYEKTLAVAGFQLVSAENGQQGLDKLKDYEPDIILLDIKMPIMNGLEMLEKLKLNPKTKDIPIIVMTNVTEDEVSQEAFQKGANLTIVKSETEPDQVINWINTVLSRAPQQ